MRVYASGSEKSSQPQCEAQPNDHSPIIVTGLQDTRQEEYPGLEALGKRREAELYAAAEVLGLRGIDFLDYIDGDLDQAPAQEAIAKIVGHLRRVKPQVVLTFGPDGCYGHPDHIAISQFTTIATVRAAELR